LCKADFEIVNKVAQVERERIIKLLEEANKCDGGLSYGNCTCTAIALIKGENK
jgi:hypothetical protein